MVYCISYIENRLLVDGGGVELGGGWVWLDFNFIKGYFIERKWCFFEFKVLSRGD